MAAVAPRAALTNVPESLLLSTPPQAVSWRRALRWPLLFACLLTALGLTWPPGSTALFTRLPPYVVRAVARSPGRPLTLSRPPLRPPAAAVEGAAGVDDDGEGEEDYDDEDDLPPAQAMSAADIDKFLERTSHGSGLMPTLVGRVGYIALLGRPNTGKSTLLNALLGYALTAVSAKPQTTRRRWLGILSDDQSQLLFLDTPGVHASNTALGKAMSSSVERAVADADVVVVMVDPTRAMLDEDETVATFAAMSRRPLILAINKCDVASPLNVMEAEQFYRDRLGDRLQAVHRISAVNPMTLSNLTASMKALLPEGPFLYPPDQMTDARERDVAAEIIRQIILERLQQEVPHAVAVVVTEFKEREDAVFIKAALHLERETQRPIVIGKGGRQIAEIRTAAERALSFQYVKPTKVSFDVVVTKDWRKDPKLVADFLGI